MMGSSEHLASVVEQLFPLPLRYRLAWHSLQHKPPLYIWRAVPPSGQFLALGMRYHRSHPMGPHPHTPWDPTAHIPWDPTLTPHGTPPLTPHGTPPLTPHGTPSSHPMGPHA
jgi:hypothetical protein